MSELTLPIDSRVELAKSASIDSTSTADTETGCCRKRRRSRSRCPTPSPLLCARRRTKRKMSDTSHKKSDESNTSDETDPFKPFPVPRCPLPMTKHFYVSGLWGEWSIHRRTPRTPEESWGAPGSELSRVCRVATGKAPPTGSEFEQEAVGHLLQSRLPKEKLSSSSPGASSSSSPG